MRDKVDRLAVLVLLALEVLAVASLKKPFLHLRLDQPYRLHVVRLSHSEADQIAQNHLLVLISTRRDQATEATIMQAELP